MNLDQALQTFLIEGRELLEDMEAALLRVAGEDDPGESVNAIFRAAHTIKGSAGLFGLDGVVSFTHVVESLLDEVRGGSLALDAPLIELLLACGDHIGVLTDAVEAGQRALEVTTTRRHGLAGAAAPAAGAPPRHARCAGPGGTGPGRARVRTHGRRLAMAPTTGTSRCASARRAEERHGPAVLHPLPGHARQHRAHRHLARRRAGRLDEMDAESCYLGFEIAFKSECDKATIERRVRIRHRRLQLRILPPHSRMAEYMR
jgi:two-component system chemotaxis sensor kinase CheA